VKVSEALSLFLDACLRNGVEPGTVDRDVLAPAAVITVRPAQWRELAFAAKTADMRWCAFWAQERNGGLEAFSCFEWDGAYLVMRCVLERGDALPSITPIYPNADRPERHAHDLLGVTFSDQPDQRRWTRHRAWGEHEYPLRADFKAPETAPTPPDHDYPFAHAHGPGIVEIPVGPVHAGIIEPGHFRFQAMGEIILNLEEHLGYVHKGIEKIAVGRDPESLARLAGRVSGDTTVAHAWAACQAMERAAKLDVPPRALALRAIFSERERVANHLGDVAAICNDAAFAFAFFQLMRLKENWVRESHAVFGHRLLMDRIVPGGVAADITAEQVESMKAHARALAREAADIVRILEDSESLEDRLMRTGRIDADLAALLGLTGHVGKASGQLFDVRVDAPYAPYDKLEVRVPHYRAGDVAARAKVRTEEIGISCDLIVRLLETLPQGSIRTPWRTPARECEGLGMVEGWRGEIITYVRLGADGRTARFFPRDPSWLTWPALEMCVQGNIVPDFPLCNKSVNGSYSGHDL
jgi:Ni,Fe-hydrogenase III large subunit